MTGVLYRIGDFCARHHWPVIALWLVVLLALGFWARSAGQQLSDNLTLPGTESQAATDILDKSFPTQANGSNPVAIEATTGNVTSGDNKTAIEKVISDLQDNDEVRSLTSPYTQAGAAQISKDGKILYISVLARDGPDTLTEDEAQSVVDDLKPALDAGLKAAVGGYIGQKVSKPATESSEVIGIVAAMIILAFTFGTLVAMGLPIITAIVGLLIGLSGIGLLGHVIEVPSVGPTLATMIGLGVGIDYALFIVTRHRRQLADGMEMRESIARATATAGGAVTFAGGTVIIALLSLLVADIPIVTALGYTAAIAVVVAVLAANTLLPAILGALGPKVNALRLPLPQHIHDDRPHGWARWANFIARRPWPALVVALVVLAALAAPVLGLTLGQQDNAALPEDTQTRQSYDILAKGFGPGVNGPLLVAVDLSKKPATSPQDQRLTTLESDIKSTQDVASVSPPQVDSSGDAALFSVISTADPSAQATTDLVNRLRDDVIPKAEQGQDYTAYVGGSTAGYIDLAARISDRLPRVIFTVVGLSFLLLLMAFRSVIIPLKAGILNVISIGAAYGVVTLVFEDGVGAELIGLPGEVPIVSFVPLMMFAILFGLSMDYEVFLMSHMKEHWEKTRDHHDSVVWGIANTGRVITSAALIMFFVFGSFVLNGDPTVKQFGVGMAVAVAVDATVVRCLLVPAVMAIIGPPSWWIPRWLDRILPRISIEGEEYFERVDREGSRDAAEPPEPEPEPEPASSR